MYSCILVNNKSVFVPDYRVSSISSGDLGIKDMKSHSFESNFFLFTLGWNI